MWVVPVFVKLFVALGVVLAVLAGATDAFAGRATVARGVELAGIDGGHLVAWAKPDGRVIVLDDRTGSRTPIVLEGGCEGAVVYDGSDGFFLVDCHMRDGHPAWLVLNARSKKVVASGDATCDYYGSIGRHWLAGGSCMHGAIIYRDWRDGQEFPTGGDEDGDPTQPYDLDTPALEPIGPERTQFVVGSGMVLAHVGHHLALTSRTSTKRIHHCDSPCRPVSVKGGLALWTDGPGYANAYAVGTKKHFEWSVSDGARLLGSTAHRVYYVTAGGDLKSFAWRR
jgi:hypothetical protein